MKRRIILTIYALMIVLGLNAQNFTLGTNIISYLNFATINAELSYAINKNWSLHLQGKLNPFTFNNGNSNQMQNRQAGLSLGGRYWMWHTNSGWFIGSSLEAAYFNIGGIFSPKTKQGYRYGLNFNIGYTFMLSKHLNLELGAGALLSYADYTIFACPKCGKELSKEKKIIFRPNNVLSQLTYVF